jgi:hypothetical protein
VGVAGAWDIDGSALQGNARGKVGVGTALKAGEVAITNKILVYQSVTKDTAAVNEGLGRVQDKILQSVLGDDPCE